MAAPGETLAEPASPQQSRDEPLLLNCALRGPPVKDYFDPVARFAREHLVRSDEIARRDDVRARLVMPGLPEPPERDGYDIIVDPRSEHGELRVRVTRGTWSAQSGYCLYVVRRPEGVTIVVQHRFEDIE
jgi:hypothetical protein